MKMMTVMKIMMMTAADEDRDIEDALDWERINSPR
jgi:hypothetical protein